MRQVLPLAGTCTDIPGAHLGDVQPYVALGKRLQRDGHRVRLATHETFRKFVSVENGLEFFDIGGDPADLMSYMVKSTSILLLFPLLARA